MNETIWMKLKRLHLRDIAHFFLFFLLFFPAQLYRRRRPHLWLLCESREEARDNAYYLFRYLRTEQPEVDAVYAISPRCPDAERVAQLGETVCFGGLRHWLYYIAAEVNISSQKAGKPNAAVCYALEVSGLWKNTRVFLQHGVVKDDLPFLHYDKTRLRLFACAAQPEYEFVRTSFGYPEGYVQQLGLCRFDALHGAVVDPDLILIAPTWRKYLRDELSAASVGLPGRSREDERLCAFLETVYYRFWSGLLTDERLLALLQEHGKRVVFCPHRDMEAFIGCFHSDTPLIQVLPWTRADVSQLIHTAAMCITDYSSLFMDFAYARRPVLYYQFDYEEFRGRHYPEGYFSYEADGFGPVCTDTTALLQALADILADGCHMPPLYQERQRSFFTLWDEKNCERTYFAIREVIQR